MRVYTMVALVLVQLIWGLPHAVLADTPDENRSVAESLEEPTPVDPTPVEEEQLESEAENSELVVQQNPFIIFLKMIAALIFVIVLIYLLLRFLNKRSQSYQSTNLLQNIGGVPLGANRSVQLVKVGERIFVVGVGESIQLLKEIDNKEEIEHLLEKREERFEKLDQPINKLFQRFKGKEASPMLDETKKQKDQTEAGFKHILQSQLTDVKDSQQKLRDAVREREK